MNDLTKERADFEAAYLAHYGPRPRVRSVCEAEWRGWQLARAALSTPAQAVPPGFVLVPVEPTPEMSAAGFCVSEAEHDPAGVYRAMLAAAPQAAQPEPSCIYPACHHNGCTEQCKKQPEQAQQPLTTCHAGRDGDCIHPLCPQLRDGEPRKSGRHCPLDEEEERC